MIASDLGVLLGSAAEQMPRHVVTLESFTTNAINVLLDLSDAIGTADRDELLQLVPHRVLGIMFYQPSTRTRLNFESAIARLGGSAVGFTSADVTRAGDFYRECLEDVVRFTGEVADLLVLRHFETGAAHRAAAVAPVPLVSAGDGYGEHPTQGLGDILAMRRELGTLEGKTIGLLGDLDIRSLKSIVIGLATMPIAGLVFLVPPGLEVPDHVRRRLDQASISWKQVEDVRQLLESCDLVDTSGTRQPNHNLPTAEPDVAPTPDSHRITRQVLERASHVPVMHPGPRTDEVADAVDSLPQAAYFRQARAGLDLRIALLAALITDG